MSTRADAFREAAAFVKQVGEDYYPRDIFIPPTSEQYAEINALLKRERGHQLDGIGADCYRHAYAVAAKLLREYADDIEDDDEPGVTDAERLVASVRNLDPEEFQRLVHEAREKTPRPSDG